MIIGQERAKHTLLQLASGERMPHALLLVGNTGSGNLAMAVWLAQLLQCERRNAPAPVLVKGLFGEDVALPADEAAPAYDGPLPCGECNACRKSSQHIHPDIHFSYPTIGTNAVSTDFLKAWRTALQENPYLSANDWLQRIGAENKQGNINKEECNAIIKKLSLKAFEGRYKILLMWLPEYLGKEGNRLLKLIEEPPEQTQFILVAENTDAILPTILSRCQLVKTDALSDEEIVTGLSQLRHTDPARARQIAFLADGDFNQALALADNEGADDSALLLDWFRKCWRGHGPDLVRWTDTFAQMGRENQKQFLHYGLHFLRELLVLVTTGNTQLRLKPDELATAQNMAKVMTIEKIGQLSAIFNDNSYYIERNANPKILFLDSSIRVHQVLKG